MFNTLPQSNEIDFMKKNIIDCNEKYPLSDGNIITIIKPN